MLRDLRIQSDALQQVTQMKLDLIAEEMAAIDSHARSSYSDFGGSRSARTIDNTGLELSSGSEQASCEKDKEKGRVNFCDNVPFCSRMSSTRTLRRHTTRSEKSNISYNNKLGEEARTHGQSSKMILDLLNEKSNEASTMQSM
jgi:hypothetical protein